MLVDELILMDKFFVIFVYCSKSLFYFHGNFNKVDGMVCDEY